MVELIMAYYVGLLIFALNGLQWMAMRQEAAKLRIQRERLIEGLRRSRRLK